MPKTKQETPPKGKAPKRGYPGIRGDLEIFASEEEGEFEVLIHGNPEGLRSFASLLLALAELDQDDLTNLPKGAKEHVHLDPDYDLSKSSCTTIVGRLDAKGTGDYHTSFRKRTKKKYRPAT